MNWATATSISLLTALLSVVAPAGRAHAAETIASGERGRPYHDVYGANLVKLLPAFRLENRATTGSGENLDLLADGGADIGFAQADVYALRLRQDRTRYGALTVIGRLGDECVYLARRVGGPVSNLAALGGEIAGRRPRIAVGPSGGGMAATWSLLSTLDPSLARAEVLNTGGTLALNQLSIRLLDAVGWVADPTSQELVLLEAVLANPELELLAVDDAKLEHALADGTRILELKSVAVPGASKAPPLRTLCTSSVIFAREGANPRLVEAVSQMLSLEREKLLRPR
jgi:TRAP-type uncharacterized transport system substrate-binding protein